jgi:hypothetical protein
MIKKNSRRSFIKKVSLTASIPLYIPSLYGASKVFLNDPIGHGDFKFEVNKDWGVQNSNIHPVNHCHEMVMDSKNRIILTTTHPKNNILIYDRSGKVLDSWGLNYPGAHGLSIVDQGGEEFLFITDPDSNKFCKTTLKGEKLIELSYPKEIQAYSNASQFKPTEIAVAENGDFYVADGYGLDYVIQYDSKGNYIRHFGGHGDGDDLFECCHGITIDSRNKTNPTLLISSRSKNEFKRFSLDGKWIETIKLPGCYVCRPVIKGEYLLFAVIVTKDWGVYDGMLAVLDKNNKVVSFPGGSSPSYFDKMLVKPEYDQVSFRNPHDVCIDNDWNLYVPQWNSGKTYPVKLTRV